MRKATFSLSLKPPKGKNIKVYIRGTFNNWGKSKNWKNEKKNWQLQSSRKERGFLSFKNKFSLINNKKNIQFKYFIEFDGNFSLWLPEEDKNNIFIDLTKKGNNSFNGRINDYFYTITLISESPKDIKDRDPFTCSITSQVFFDPVLMSDEHTYEREAIKKSLSDDSRSPLTREEMFYEQPRLNRGLLQQIQDNKELLKDQYLPIQSMQKAIKKKDQKEVRRLRTLDIQNRFLTARFEDSDQPWPRNYTKGTSLKEYVENYCTPEIKAAFELKPALGRSSNSRGHHSSTRLPEERPDYASSPASESDWEPDWGSESESKSQRASESEHESEDASSPESDWELDWGSDWESEPESKSQRASESKHESEPQLPSSSSFPQSQTNFTSQSYTGSAAESHTNSNCERFVLFAP